MSPHAGRATQAFLGALLTQDQPAALRIVQEAFRGRGARHVYDEVVTPALQQVGALWYENRISVADEHAATAIARAAVAALYPEFAPAAGGPRALVCCVEGERHDFGARMVADLVTLEGWDATFLGADTPTGALVKMVGKLQPVLVALSVTVPLHLPAARQAIYALRAISPARVVVGGRALASLADAATKLGADAVGTTASAALDLVRPWRPTAPAS